ncbi:MAG: glycosyl transferase family 1 [Methylocystaceae bacterium]|nr:MAG: glycosyl transferase family 1 [Methylocystaceae bacterium]
MESAVRAETSVASSATAPFAGKTVAVVHAAWHSCGSYQVNVSQMIAYRALGARVISIALMDAPGPLPPRGARWRAYLAATDDLPADKRYFCGADWRLVPTPGFLGEAWWPLIHGDQAVFLVELAKRAAVPPELQAETIDLIHANHYFTLPFVSKLRGARNISVILETQDIQARQYVLRNKGGFFLPPYATYEDMLQIELEWMKTADLCVHLNEAERADFATLLPKARHRLVYPAVAPVPAGPGGNRIIIVASDNYANYVSLRWFLQEVLPLAPQADVEIYGNIDGGVKSRDKALYETHRRCFKGRVDDIGAVYADSACVLLPTIEGHGLSIKAVEALASGAPIIATPQAFRGMKIDPRTLSNVALVEDAQGFAAALRDADARRGAREAPPRAASDTRRLYDEVFSFSAYTRALHEAAAPLVSS